MKNTLVLWWNDLASALKNRSIYLVIFIPIFAVMSLRLVDRADMNIRPLNIGIVQNMYYPSAVIVSLRSEEKLFLITMVQSEKEGEKLLKDRVLDGVLLQSKGERRGLELLVVRKGSPQSLALVAGLTALQRRAERKSATWISEVRPLHEGDVQRQTLPTWVLMSVLLVGLIIIPAQVAEEKEKKLLLGLLQTPIREIEWLFAKLFLGIVLSLSAVALLHALGGFDLGQWWSYLIFLGVGSFCFSSIGIMLGFLCATQASARTLGVLFYLPLMLPAALSDLSSKLSVVAPFFPSYQFFLPIRSILLEGGQMNGSAFELLYLLLIGSCALFFAAKLLKKRWLM